MRGLRTPLDKRSENYFSLVENAAKRKGCIFFLECETGMHDLELPEYSLFDAGGWLVPEKDVEAFAKDYEEYKEDSTDRWDAYFCWAKWEYENGEITIRFKNERKQEI